MVPKRIGGGSFIFHFFNVNLIKKIQIVSVYVCVCVGRGGAGNSGGNDLMFFPLKKRNRLIFFYKYYNSLKANIFMRIYIP